MIFPKRDDRRRMPKRLPGRLDPAAPDPTLRLRQLQEVSQLLTAFDGIDKTFPDVMAILARALSVRSAVLVIQGPTAAETTVWTPAGVSTEERIADAARAATAFAYLTGGRGPEPRPPDAAAPQRFLTLPLVVDRHKTFGVLQLEGEALDETDLHFANAVANQLAVALRRSAAEAERETLLVSERHARADAEAANRAKDEFLAHLSHELRTPLNAITGWAHLLRGGHLGAAEHTKAIETICRNADTQKQLIEDILDVHSIVSGRLQLNVHAVDLAAVVESARDTMQPAADRKGIEIRVAVEAEPRTVTGDADRLRQVVWNLLANAIKFTPKGGRVDVALRSAGATRVEITVADDGPGIPAEFLAHVFDRFRQAGPARRRRHGGLGLGLAISKNIVELHEGTIRAANKPEGGALFTVTLPVGTAPPESAPVARLSGLPADAESATTLEGVLVLVVDDTPDDREVLARMLEHHGATVLAAPSAAEGFTILERERPHVLLSDISMPDEDGYAFLRRVRELPADRGGLTPAAAVTAFASAEERQHALGAGFHEHLSKPVDVRALVRVVAALADRSRPREERQA